MRPSSYRFDVPSLNYIYDAWLTIRLLSKFACTSNPPFWNTPITLTPLCGIQCIVAKKIRWEWWEMNYVCRKGEPPQTTTIKSTLFDLKKHQKFGDFPLWAKATVSYGCFCWTCYYNSKLFILLIWRTFVVVFLLFAFVLSNPGTSPPPMIDPPGPLEESLKSSQGGGVSWQLLVVLLSHCCSIAASRISEIIW